MLKKLLVPLLAGALAILALPGPTATADHTWSDYHWARTSNPFTLKAGDNVTSAWDSYLDTAISDWNKSSVLDVTKVRGGTSRYSCRPTAGRMEVCNASYGSNGWLGLASVWTNGSHITQGTVKLNDTYYSQARYNTVAYRNLVMCQEIGHVFGLGHQDENQTNENLDTCMDYTNNPESNQHPNQHDYDLLEEIYGHADSTTTIGQSAQSAAKMQRVPAGRGVPAEWGDALVSGHAGAGHKAHGHAHAHPHAYVRDLGNGNAVFTFVVWAE
jgi:hypothetical protein